jgi:hypothetical protein
MTACSKETQINWYRLGSHSSLFSPQSLSFMGFKELLRCLEKFGSVNQMSPVFSSHENASQVTRTNISRTVIIQSGWKLQTMRNGCTKKDQWVKLVIIIVIFHCSCFKNSYVTVAILINYSALLLRDRLRTECSYESRFWFLKIGTLGTRLPVENT